MAKKVSKKILTQKRKELEEKYKWKKPKKRKNYRVGKIENLQCPHCGTKGRGPVMYRYHFNRCPMRYEE
jgi:hypothetical protein